MAFDPQTDKISITQGLGFLLMTVPVVVFPFLTTGWWGSPGWAGYVYFIIGGASGAIGASLFATVARRFAFVGGLVGAVSCMWVCEFVLARVTSIHSGILAIIACIGALPGILIFQVGVKMAAAAGDREPEE